MRTAQTTACLTAAALALGLTAALPAAAHAQGRAHPARAVTVTAAPAAAPAPAPAAAPATPVTRGIAVPEGTEFYVVTTEDLSSKNAASGQRVGMKVDENVLVGGQLVITKGTPVRAEVNEAKGSGMFGRAGKLTLRVLSTTAVDGQKVALTGSPQAAGKGRGATVAAVSLLVSPVGVFIHGKNAEIASGTRLTVYTDEAITIAAAPVAGVAPAAGAPQ
ncbi:hypothetical protein tb265_12660 [Gemmatimonadetes bacterium T265]|nr:hypothetical protein tb265_12660 [Gemmatimonadetes bacterium T265]